MASAFKNIQAAVLAGPTTLYTAGAGLSSALVHGLYLANTHATDTVNITLEIHDSSAVSTRKILNNVPIPANSSLVLDKPINLEPNDYIQATASSANVDATGSILELS